MSIRGQKIIVDLGDDDENAAGSAPGISSLVNFIGDIKERSITKADPPKPPAQRSTTDGFPVHRKRLYQSRFKASRSGIDNTTPSQAPPAQDAEAAREPPSEPYVDTRSEEQRQIDLENQRRLDSMSDAEIQKERQELFENMNPDILQALLRRSKLETGGVDGDFPGVEADDTAPITNRKKSAKKVTFGEVQSSGVSKEEESGRNQLELEQDPTEEAPLPMDQLPTSGKIHFPRPDQPPNLDPNSPSFLEDLHKKYFPSLPADPEKLEWMKSSTTPNTYSTTQSGLDAKDIRFDFSGALIPPSEAAEIPVTAGLHHHGDNPDAAGYTIPELARLARSKVAAQRCIAFQTLGRILYRLGRGEFGDPSEGESGTMGAEDTLAELARGLWAEVEKEHVISICTSESEGKSITGQKHVSAQAYATEAVWLWQRGGGRRWRTD